MKIKLKSLILLTAIGLSMNSCADGFIEMNTNPNESAKVAPQNLLGPTIYKTLVANINRNLRVNNELMQVTVTRNNNLEFHRYEVRATETEYMWRSWYIELTNIRDIYTSAAEGQQPGYQAYQGISKILDVWVSSLLTDMYGDVPYFESNQGYHELNTTPVFERQIDIYRDMFLKLEQANQLINEAISVAAADNNRPPIPAAHASMDPIYGANVLKWQKFANSLYLRLLLRVSHKPELNAAVKIREIVETKAAQYPIMESHDDSAILYFTSQEPYQNPYLNARPIDFNGNKGYSEFFIDNLFNMQDPRLAKWATQPTLGAYIGIQSGYPRGQVPDPQSTLLPALMSEPLLGNIMNFAELQLILAECALRGFTEQDAEALYNAGVTSAIEMWGESVPATYFNNPLNGILPTDGNEEILKKIHLQKYFALMFTDFQQWYEYRRTKALDLIPGPGWEDRKMPVRMTYPLITIAINKTNYDAAVARIGGDNPNSLMWWQPEN